MDTMELRSGKIVDGTKMKDDSKEEFGKGDGVTGRLCCWWNIKKA